MFCIYVRRYIFFKIYVLYYFFFSLILSWCLAPRGRPTHSLSEEPKDEEAKDSDTLGRCPVLQRLCEGGALCSRSGLQRLCEQPLLRSFLPGWSSAAPSLSSLLSSSFSNSSSRWPRSPLAPPEACPSECPPSCSLRQGSRATKNWARSCKQNSDKFNSSLTRQPLVKGATLVQTELNAVMLLWCPWGWLSLSLLASFLFRGAVASSKRALCTRNRVPRRLFWPLDCSH